MTDTVEVADVAVIGLGYIGLPTAAVLARAGLDVVGVDRVRERVEAVNRGELPFLEEGLATVLAEQVETGRLRAQMETPSARTYIIAVPTPSMGPDHVADLSLVDGRHQADRTPSDRSGRIEPIASARARVVPGGRSTPGR